jgi:hypothetical protein
MIWRTHWCDLRRKMQPLNHHYFVLNRALTVILNRHCFSHAENHWKNKTRKHKFLLIWKWRHFILEKWLYKMGVHLGSLFACLVQAPKEELSWAILIWCEHGDCRGDRKLGAEEDAEKPGSPEKANEKITTS